MQAMLCFIFTFRNDPLGNKGEKHLADKNVGAVFFVYQKSVISENAKPESRRGFNLVNGRAVAKALEAAFIQRKAFRKALEQRVKIKVLILADSVKGKVCFFFPDVIGHKKEQSRLGFKEIR